MSALVALLAVLLALAPARSPRIVSLMPSLTEDLCAIGAARQLVGVSEFSDDIPCAKGLPRVNNFAALNAERIISLRPDVVVAIPSQRVMVAPLERAGLRVEFLPDDSYNDIFIDIQHLGDLSLHEREAEHLMRGLHAQTAALRATERFRRRPSVFFIEQAMPLWTVGPKSYIATLISLAGGRLATSSLQQPYVQYSTEALLRLDPDAIVATGDAALQNVLTREPWRSLRAVRNGHVFVLANGNLLVRPGPRYNEGLRWLIARLSSL